MERITIRGTVFDAFVAGSGRPLLYLHSEAYFTQTKPFLDVLSQSYKVIAPRHPGYGASPLGAFHSVGDLAYHYLDVVDELGLDDLTVVGSSLGGWIALEMAVRSCERLRRIALIGSVGVKFGHREQRDFLDIYNRIPENEIRGQLFTAPERFLPDIESLSPAEKQELATERQIGAVYAWSPYMHNPALCQWLHRVKSPSLVLWGDRDGFATPDYGRKLAAALPQATFALVEGSGHYPQIEQPKTVADAIAGFIGN